MITMVQWLEQLKRLGRLNAFRCLVLGYVLYNVLGGLVFMFIEMPVERSLRAEVEDIRRAFLLRNPCVQESRLDDLLRTALETDRSDVAVLKANSEERHYDLTSSLFFVIVTLSTTGYDFYSPISEEAKLFCIFYCTLGIPLTLFLLSCLSDLLLPIVTHGPVRHLQTHWGLPYSRAALLHGSLLWVVIIALLFLLPALTFWFLEPEWSFLDAVFFCFVTLSTIGQGGYSLGRTWDRSAREMLKLLTTCYLMVGLVVILLFKETALQVPQVQALFRLFSGPREGDLKGLHLEELELDRDSPDWNLDEEPRYSLPISMISPCPAELVLPSPVQSTPPSFPFISTITPECPSSQTPNLHGWQPGIKNPYRGMVVWQVPENVDITVTLFKETGKGHRKVLASADVNMKKFANATPGQYDLTLQFKPRSVKVVEATLKMTLTCVFLKEGKATDEDMQSLASLMSLKPSDIGNLDDFNDSDEEGEERRAGVGAGLAPLVTGQKSARPGLETYGGLCSLSPLRDGVE
ncbi:potassium channel, subfamily K, member 7 [Aplochiton taeniatus]